MQRGWVASEEYRALIGSLTAARQAKGLSQRELARRLAKPPSFINKIELRERRLDLLEFITIARAMDCSPTSLLKEMIDAAAGRSTETQRPSKLG